MKKDDGIRIVRDRLIDRILKDDRKNKIHVKKLEFKKSSLMIEHTAQYFYEKSLLFNIFMKGYFIKVYIRDLGTTNDFIPFETTKEEFQSVSNKKYFIDIADHLYDTIVNPTGVI